MDSSSPRTDSAADAEKKPEQEAQASPQAKSDPFGDESNCEIKYKVMRWWQAGMIMIAETISLGILSLPSVLATIGFLGGMILILSLGIIATYTGYVLGQFKLRYPQVHSMADAGEVMMGPIGREILGAAQLIFLIFVMGSHVLVASIMLNVLTGHATCSIVFGLVGMVASLILTLPRKLGDVSYMAIASFISIIGACLITMVGVAVEHPGQAFVSGVPEPVSFTKAFLSVTNIIFAYAGHVAFFSFMSELRDPAEYPKALLLLQGSDTLMYLLVAAVIYVFAGENVTSPALSSTSLVLEKAAYGVAIPTIIIAGVINGHVASKYIYVRIFRGTGIMGERGLKAYGSWALISLFLWTVAWIIAEAIPVFNDLLGLISALFASWFTYGISGAFWLFMNHGTYRASKKQMFLTVVNCLVIVMGAVIMGLGLYSSATAIGRDSTHGGAFSCANNAQ